MIPPTTPILPFPLAIALLFALLGVPITALVLYVATPRRPPPPFGAPADLWNTAMRTPTKVAGPFLGFLERLLFFGALWYESPTVIAAWLAFKVASKWEAWSNIVKVPDTVDPIAQVDLLRTRHWWGSRLYMSSVIGTITNILISLLAVEFAHLAIK